MPTPHHARGHNPRAVETRLGQQGLHQQWTSPVSRFPHELTLLMLSSILLPLGLTRFLPAQGLRFSVHDSFSGLSWPRTAPILWGQVLPPFEHWPLGIRKWGVSRCWPVSLQSQLAKPSCPILGLYRRDWQDCFLTWGCILTSKIEPCSCWTLGDEGPKNTSKRLT